ncbi:MAG: HIT family protein [Bdellovibrionales bacterium]
MNCLFCGFVDGSVPCHKVWEDDKHMAFLTIFPNTPGVTVVITKDHHDSYFADVPESVRTGLVNAAATVAKKIDAAFPDVGRCAMVFEGFGVNHIHAKLFPLHGTALPEWKPIKRDQRKFFDQYEGFISSHDCERADDKVLADIAAKIRAA